MCHCMIYPATFTERPAQRDILQYYRRNPAFEGAHLHVSAIYTEADVNNSVWISIREDSGPPLYYVDTLINGHASYEGTISENLPRILVFGLPSPEARLLIRTDFTFL